MSHHATWSAATTGSSAAAGLELSTDTAVMAIGGFTGRDPVPTLEQFKADVAADRVTYYVVLNDWRGRPGGPWGDSSHSDIDEWVTATFPATAVGNATVYDLSHPPGSLELAVIVWVGFPVVLLTGSIAWERVAPITAAIHAGDWLVKLVLLAVIIGLLH